MNEMAARKKYVLYTWDEFSEKWVWAFESYQYGEVRRYWIQLEKDGYDVDYRYEIPKEKE